MNDHAGHEKRVCSCGVVIRQCRCSDPGKTVTVVQNGCRACSDPRAVVPAKLAQQAVSTLQIVAADLAEAFKLLRVIPVLDTNWTPADAQAWEARRQALLARIDGKETP